MNRVAELLEQRWAVYRQRPFWRLVEVFVARIFRGGGDADQEGLDVGLGLVLTFLAAPGGFVSILLFNKYGSLLQWLRGQTNVDTLWIAFPDEYFFIVLSMTVTGAVAVWRWDAIFPDRRDYINLVPLPISTRTIFFANLAAVVFLVLVVALDANAASCILFPTVVAAAQSRFGFAVRFALVHAVGVVAASVFVFLAVFALLGVLMALLSPGAFRRVSAYLRGAIAIYLVALLCTSFVVPDRLRRIQGPAPPWTWLMPSCWFVGLCQQLRGKATPVLAELAHLIVPVSAALLVAALGMYAVSYRRHFVRIAELSEGGAASRRPAGPWSGAWSQRWALRGPMERGCFGFVKRTLLRSEAHRLIMTSVVGLGLVLASEALVEAFDSAKSTRQIALSAGALSVPFILSYCVVLGLRAIFELPVELRANWIFQLLVDPGPQAGEPLARKVILLAVLPATLGTVFPLYLYVAGPLAASLHTLLVGVSVTLLTRIVLIRFRKLPFTCTLPVFQQHSIVILVSLCFGYLIYAVSTPEFESSALDEPWRMLRLLPIVGVAWYVPRYFDRATVEVDRRLIFEESVTRTVEVLRLSE